MVFSSFFPKTHSRAVDTLIHFLSNTFILFSLLVCFPHNHRALVAGDAIRPYLLTSDNNGDFFPLSTGSRPIPSPQNGGAALLSNGNTVVAQMLTKEVVGDEVLVITQATILSPDGRVAQREFRISESSGVASNIELSFAVVPIITPNLNWTDLNSTAPDSPRWTGSSTTVEGFMVAYLNIKTRDIHACLLPNKGGHCLVDTVIIAEEVEGGSPTQIGYARNLALYLIPNGNIVAAFAATGGEDPVSGTAVYLSLFGVVPGPTNIPAGLITYVHHRRVNQLTDGDQSGPTIVGLPGHDGYVVIFSSTGTSSAGVYARTYWGGNTSNAIRLFHNNNSTHQPSLQHSCVAFADGIRFICVWQNVDGNKIVFQSFNSALSPLGGDDSNPIPVNTLYSSAEQQTAPILVRGGGGDLFFVVWNDHPILSQTDSTDVRRISCAVLQSSGAVATEPSDCGFGGNATSTALFGIGPATTGLLTSSTSSSKQSFEVRRWLPMTRLDPPIRMAHTDTVDSGQFDPWSCSFGWGKPVVSVWATNTTTRNNNGVQVRIDDVNGAQILNATRLDQQKAPVRNPSHVRCAPIHTEQYKLQPATQAMIVWASNHNSSKQLHVRGRVINSDGSFATGDFHIASTGTNSFERPAVTCSGSTTCVVCYENKRNATRISNPATDVECVTVSNIGTVGAARRVNTNPSTLITSSSRHHDVDVAVVADSPDPHPAVPLLFATWTDTKQNNDVVARAFYLDTNEIDTSLDFCISCTPFVNESTPSLAMVGHTPYIGFQDGADFTVVKLRLQLLATTSTWRLNATISPVFQRTTIKGGFVGEIGVVGGSWIGLLRSNGSAGTNVDLFILDGALSTQSTSLSINSGKGSSRWATQVLAIDPYSFKATWEHPADDDSGTTSVSFQTFKTVGTLPSSITLDMDAIHLSDGACDFRPYRTVNISNPGQLVLRNCQFQDLLINGYAITSRGMDVVITDCTFTGELNIDVAPHMSSIRTFSITGGSIHSLSLQNEVYATTITVSDVRVSSSIILNMIMHVSTLTFKNITVAEVNGPAVPPASKSACIAFEPRWFWRSEISIVSSSIRCIGVGIHVFGSEWHSSRLLMQNVDTVITSSVNSSAFPEALVFAPRLFNGSTLDMNAISFQSRQHSSNTGDVSNIRFGGSIWDSAFLFNDAHLVAINTQGGSGSVSNIHFDSFMLMNRLDFSFSGGSMNAISGLGDVQNILMNASSINSTVIFNDAHLVADNTLGGSGRVSNIHVHSEMFTKRLDFTFSGGSMNAISGPGDVQNILMNASTINSTFLFKGRASFSATSYGTQNVTNFVIAKSITQYTTTTVYNSSYNVSWIASSTDQFHLSGINAVASTIGGDASNVRLCEAISSNCGANVLIDHQSNLTAQCADNTCALVQQLVNIRPASSFSGFLRIVEQTTLLADGDTPTSEANVFNIAVDAFDGHLEIVDATLKAQIGGAQPSTRAANVLLNHLRNITVDSATIIATSSGTPTVSNFVINSRASGVIDGHTDATVVVQSSNIKAEGGGNASNFDWLSVGPSAWSSLLCEIRDCELRVNTSSASLQPSTAQYVAALHASGSGKEVTFNFKRSNFTVSHSGTAATAGILFDTVALAPTVNVFQSSVSIQTTRGKAAYVYFKGINGVDTTYARTATEETTAMISNTATNVLAIVLIDTDSVVIKHDVRIGFSSNFALTGGGDASGVHLGAGSSIYRVFLSLTGRQTPVHRLGSAPNSGELTSVTISTPSTATLFRCSGCAANASTFAFEQLSLDILSGSSQLAVVLVEKAARFWEVYLGATYLTVSQDFNSGDAHFFSFHSFVEFESIFVVSRSEITLRGSGDLAYIHMSSSFGQNKVRTSTRLFDSKEVGIKFVPDGGNNECALVRFHHSNISNGGVISFVNTDVEFPFLANISANTSTGIRSVLVVSGGSNIGIDFLFQSVETLGLHVVPRVKTFELMDHLVQVRGSAEISGIVNFYNASVGLRSSALSLERNNVVLGAGSINITSTTLQGLGASAFITETTSGNYQGAVNLNGATLLGFSEFAGSPMSSVKVVSACSEWQDIIANRTVALDREHITSNGRLSNSQVRIVGSVHVEDISYSQLYTVPFTLQCEPATEFPLALALAVGGAVVLSALVVVAAVLVRRRLRKITVPVDINEDEMELGEAASGGTVDDTSEPSSNSASPTVPNPLASPTMPSSPSSPKRPPISFRKGRLIGSGGFGRVYLGFDANNNVLMAAKEIIFGPDQSKAAYNVVLALQKEVSTMKRLQHENVVRYFGADRQSDAFYILMEYVPGGTLKGIVDDYGAMSPQMTADFTRQILQGLEYIHSKCIVHRDIKAVNILISLEGVAKIGDFGASRNFDTVTGTCGTPYWMAPEVVRGESVSWPSDIWSLGCTVMEMLTQQLPFSDLGSPYKVMHMLGSSYAEMPIPDAIGDTAARDFLRQCLQRDPSSRPSAAELLQHPFLAPATFPVHAHPDASVFPSSSGSGATQAASVDSSLPYGTEHAATSGAASAAGRSSTADVTASADATSGNVAALAARRMMARMLDTLQNTSLAAEQNQQGREEELEGLPVVAAVAVVPHEAGSSYNEIMFSTPDVPAQDELLNRIRHFCGDAESAMIQVDVDDSDEVVVGDDETLSCASRAAPPVDDADDSDEVVVDQTFSSASGGGNTQ